MTYRQAIAAAAAAGLLLQACGQTQPAPVRTAQPTSISIAPQSRLLASGLDAFARQTSYNARNQFMIENVLGDAADGEMTTRVDVNETRFGDMYEVFVIVIGETTEARSYIAKGKTGVFQLFVKGPSPDLGIDDDAWHVTEDQMLTNDRLNALPTRVLPELLAVPDAIEAAFGDPVDIAHDDIACKAYRAPASKLPEQLLAGFARMLSRVDALDLTVTLCDDGLPHMLQVVGRGLGTTDAAKPGRVEVLLEFTSFGRALPVQAPADARPLVIRSPAAAEPPTPDAKPESSAAADNAPLVNMNDGSYGADAPMAGVVTDLLPVRFDAEKDELNYMSHAEPDDLMAFYRAHYVGERGLRERTFVTSVFDKGFSIVFDGLEDGRAVVVQATRIAENAVTVNISKRKE